MVKKTYVLDTNVLLTDPNALTAFEENDVVLPFVVLEELDRHKVKLDQTGAHARNVSRQIHDLIDKSSKNSLKSGILLSNGSKLKVTSHTDFEGTLKTNLFKDKESADNQILIVALGLNQSKGATAKRTILVTNDMLLRIKANSHGLTTESHEKQGIVDSVDGMYTGVCDMKISAQEMADLCETQNNKDKFAKTIERIVGAPINPNEFISFTMNNGTGTDEPFIVRYTKKGIKILPEHYQVSEIRPRNIEQKLLMDLLLDPTVKLVTCVGKAGTGKSLCILAAGLEQVLDKKRYKSLIVLRPIQPVGKDVGFLPGTLEEKLEPWIAPIKDNLRFLISQEDGGKKSKNSENVLNYYFEQGIIEVEALTFIRGRSIPNAYILIDEAQNLSAHELKTIITRAGEGTKIVLNGDIEQVDNMSVDSVSNGLAVAVEKFKDSTITGHVTLRNCERSDLAELAATKL
jgi:PhoH-like ATPase